MKQSLSGVDHCYDNARMESFFATLKKELIYRLPVYSQFVGGNYVEQSCASP